MHAQKYNPWNVRAHCHTWYNYLYLKVACSVFGAPKLHQGILDTYGLEHQRNHTPNQMSTSGQNVSSWVEGSLKTRHAAYDMQNNLTERQ